MLNDLIERIRLFLPKIIIKKICIDCDTWARFVFKTLSFWLLLCSSVVFAGEKIPATQLEKVTLQLKWFHAFQFAGYYAAKQQGYYADEGLDVQILERSLVKPVVDQVLSGQAN